MAIKKEDRLSRLHDERGNFINPKDLGDIFPAMYEKLKLILGLELNKPFINYPSIKIFKSYLSKKDVLYEWGSGRSTSFFAKRVYMVHSVESDKKWLNTTENLLKKKNLMNYTLDFHEDDISEEFLNAPTLRKTKEEDGKDKVYVIDGGPRNLCAQLAGKICKNNDIIYLDDSDKNWSLIDVKRRQINDEKNIRGAYLNLLSTLGNRGFASVSVRGFSPTNLFVKESTFFFHVENQRFMKVISRFAAS